MLRYVLIFGAISGALAGALMVVNVAFVSGETGAGSAAFGYLSFLLAFSAIFVAIKRFRDQERGGVIKFWPAFVLGLGVALGATLVYVISWEVYFAQAGADWVETYTSGLLEKKRAAGAPAAELEALAAQMADFAELYARPWFRILITISEILPIGLLVNLVSAALLRNPNVLPARR